MIEAAVVIHSPQIGSFVLSTSSGEAFVILLSRIDIYSGTLVDSVLVCVVRGKKTRVRSS